MHRRCLNVHYLLVLSLNALRLRCHALIELAKPALHGHAFVALYILAKCRNIEAAKKKAKACCFASQAAAVARRHAPW
jgi:hypothetical protein